MEQVEYTLNFSGLADRKDDGTHCSILRFQRVFAGWITSASETSIIVTGESELMEYHAPQFQIEKTEQLDRA